MTLSIGDRVSVKHLDSITRDLWGALGVVSKIMESPPPPEDYWLRRRWTEEVDKFFVMFDEPTKSVGVWLHGIWLAEVHLEHPEEIRLRVDRSGGE